MPGPAPRYRAHRQATHRFTPAPYTLRSPHQPASATQESTNQIGSNHELKHASWDPINVAERILSRSKSIVDSDADQEFFLEILQAGVESRLHSLGSRRARILRALQDIAAHSNKLPSRVKVLKIHNRVFKEAGGEATIWHAELEGVGVVLREARPPEDHDWTSPEGLKTLSAIRREIISHIQIQHLNVLPILGISSNEGHPLSIVTPLAMNGNAFRYLSGLSDVRQRADKMLEIVQDITLAIKYIHGLAPPIIHGDLHARNILVDQEGRGLLCDFGLSRIKHEPTRSSTSIIEGGRYRYLAPELLSPETESFRTTTASDCYAFSMTILELATLQKPFVEYENEMAAFGAAGRGVRPQRPPQTAFGALNSRATNLLCTLLEEMWNHDAFKRPSMHDVLSSVNEISSHQAYHPSSELAYPYLHPSEYNVLPPASTHTLPLISNGRASISPNLASSHPPSPQATTISATADETTSNNGVIDLDTGQSLLRILDALKGVKSLSLEAQQEVALVQDVAIGIFLLNPSQESWQATPYAHKKHLQNFYSKLYVLAWVLSSCGCHHGALAITAHAHCVVSVAYDGDTRQSHLAELLHREGFVHYRAGHYRDAIQTLQETIELCWELSPMDDSKMLWCLAHSLDIVARSHVELGTIAPAEIFARKALELSETGLLRFGLGPGADADWVTLRVPSSLTTLARVYCGLNKLAAARLYVRRAVEYSREIFHCSPLPQTANKFACALHWYEELLAQLRVGEDNDLSELCSLEDWKALSAHLRISKKWPIYSYVAEKVQVLNGLQ